MLRRLFQLGCVVAVGVIGVVALAPAGQSRDEVVNSAATNAGIDWKTSVKLANDTLIYEGPIDKDGASRFIDLAKSDAVKAVKIKSPGGDYEAAMMIGNVINEKDLMLSVSICVSSCADPIFIMARRKSVEPGGFLAVHGTPAFNSDVVVKNTSGDASTNGETKKVMDQLFARRVAMLQNYSDAGFDVRFHLPYLQFLARQNAYYANGDVRSPRDRQGCPRAQILWVPPLAYWKEFGLRGVESFWYPEPGETGTITASVAEIADPATPAVFYGDALQLNALCR